MLNLVLSGRTEVDETHVCMLMLSFSFFPFSLSENKVFPFPSSIYAPDNSSVKLCQKKINVSKAIEIVEEVSMLG